MSVITLSLICHLFFIINNFHSISSMNNNNKAIQINPRIIGGRLTTIRQHPFMVSILLRYNYLPFCGGSYIQRKWVLTAAHCLMISRTEKIHPRLLIVMAGSSLISHSPTAQYSNIDAVLPHPFYSPYSMTRDIGLIKLERAFRVNDYTQYSTLPRNYNYDLFAKPKLCTVTGWGFTSLISPKLSNQLLEIHVPLMSRRECMLYVYSWISSDQLCAGIKEGGVDACKSDSGGPLICDGEQIGIVSWGLGCGNKSAPGVYTRVDMYLKWINQSIMRNCGILKKFSVILILVSFMSCLVLTLLVFI